MCKINLHDVHLLWLNARQRERGGAREKTSERERKEEREREIYMYIYILCAGERHLQASTHEYQVKTTRRRTSKGPPQFSHAWWCKCKRFKWKWWSRQKWKWWIQCVRVYACVCVCVCMCVCAHMYVCMHVSACMSKYVFSLARVRSHSLFAPYSLLLC